MCAYKFYWFDKTEKAHFIGILREKRENLPRITKDEFVISCHSRACAP